MKILVLRLWMPNGYHGAAFLPGLIIFKSGIAVDPPLAAHELAHQMQMRRLGWWRFAITYLWYAVRLGYDKNPHEVAARAQERSPYYLELARRLNIPEKGWAVTKYPEVKK